VARVLGAFLTRHAWARKVPPEATAELNLSESSKNGVTLEAQRGHGRAAGALLALRLNCDGSRRGCSPVLALASRTRRGRCFVLADSASAPMFANAG